MKIYKLVWADDSLSKADRVEWFTSEQVMRKRKTEIKRTGGVNSFIFEELSGPVEIPTKRIEFIAWMNENHNYSIDEL